MILKFFKLIFLLISTSIYSQTGLNFKITEYGVLNYAADSKSQASEIVLKDKPKMDKISEVLIFKNFIPFEQKFSIDPLKKNTVTGLAGVRIEFPENSFNSETNIELLLTEYIDEIDFISSGHGQIFYNKYGSEQLMLSGGMFKIKFQKDGKEISLEKGKYIEIQFPDYFPKENFGLFYFEDGVWNLKSSLSKSEKSLISESASFEKKSIIGVRLAKVDKSGLWNFASTEVTNNSISVKKDSPNFIAILIPRNGRGFVLKEIKEISFSLPAYKNSSLDLLLVKDDSYVVQTFQSADKTFNDKNPEGNNNTRQEIIINGDWKKLSNTDLKDKQLLRQKLGFPVYSAYISYKKQ